MTSNFLAKEGTKSESITRNNLKYLLTYFKKCAGNWPLNPENASFEQTACVHFMYKSLITYFKYDIWDLLSDFFSPFHL